MERTILITIVLLVVVTWLVYKLADYVEPRK
jgi:hypothetical protein